MYWRQSEPAPGHFSNRLRQSQAPPRLYWLIPDSPDGNYDYEIESGVITLSDNDVADASIKYLEIAKQLNFENY